MSGQGPSRPRWHELLPHGPAVAAYTFRTALESPGHYTAGIHVTSFLPQHLMGVFVTREHVRHNKSGIAHRGKTRLSH
jgi:hypothetical protein